jgi:hypothetical protein
MKRSILVIAAAALALSACGKQADAPTGDAESKVGAGSPAAEPEAPLDPATPIEGDPASAWVEMMGNWAQEGDCGNYQREWVIGAEEFSLYEMHCPVRRLELLANGVRAIADCTVEGDNDGVEDAYQFVRQADFSLTIVQEANGAETTGLFLCEGEDTEL